MLVSLALAACGDDVVAPAPVVPPAVASVEIVGESQPITIGATRSLAVVLRDANGTTITGRPVIWTSSDPAVATVSATGNVAALSAGTATIMASAGGRDGLRVVSVQPVPVGDISVPFPQLTLLRHESRTIEASARDAQGVPMTNIQYTWSSDNESVAVVMPSGRVVALGSGTAVITVSAGGRSATVQVTVPPSIVSVRVTPAAAVLPVGSSRQYAVVAVDDRGREVTGRAVTWNSSTPTVARVSPTGQVTALMPGYATISATVDGVSGAVALTVEATDWYFEENLFSGRVIARSDTSHRFEHGYTVTETRLVKATIALDEQTGAWTLSGELVQEERNYFLGNVMWRETARWAIQDRGSTVARDIVSNMRTLRSAITGSVQYRMTIGTRSAWLEGKLPGYAIEMAFQLNR
jgi:uncharacterized protein YjdB